MREKTDRELLDMLLKKENYQSRVWDALVLEVKKRDLKVKWNEIDTFNAETQASIGQKNKLDSERKREDIFIGIYCNP